MLAVQDRLAVRRSRLAVRLAVQAGVSAGARLPALPDMLPANPAEGRLAVHVRLVVQDRLAVLP